MKPRILPYLILIWFFAVTTPPLEAQEKESKSDWHLGLSGGPYLPSMIAGVTEIMKAFGGRVTYFDDVFGFEFWGLHSAEDGAAVNYGGLSFVKGLKLPGVDDFTVIITGGLHGMYYHRAPVNGVSYPYTRSRGIHLGAGLITPIKGAWSFRGATTILNGPGRSIWVEASLIYSFGVSDTVKEKN